MYCKSCSWVYSEASENYKVIYKISVKRSKMSIDLKSHTWGDRWVNAQFFLNIMTDKESIETHCYHIFELLSSNAPSQFFVFHLLQLCGMKRGYVYILHSTCIWYLKIIILDNFKIIHENIYQVLRTKYAPLQSKV